MKCRHCAKPVSVLFCNLGTAPLSNALLSTDTLHLEEKYIPLNVLVCTKCWLVQTEDHNLPSEIFDAEYSYFSSISKSWLRHASKYTDLVIERFALDRKSLVLEVAANDGYLLQFFQQKGIPCLGIEPTASTAATAKSKHIPIIQAFFNEKLARVLAEGGHSADLIVANNVLAHVPDINDFVSGFAVIMKPEGVATFEFPWLVNTVEQNQFDTIYHEHFSYLSLTSVASVFKENGLSIFDVEKLSTHGGSLRVFAQRSESCRHSVHVRVNDLLTHESQVGIASESFYRNFQEKAIKVKNDFLAFLLAERARGKTIAAYGAAAKGNTLLNFCGVRSDLISFVVDRSPGKQGKFLPGSRIPIVDESWLQEHRPNYIVILPWNIREEIESQLTYVREWGAQFVIAVPELRVW